MIRVGQLRMGHLYFASLLVMAGTCIAFGLHAATLALQTKNRQYLHLLLLSVLEGAYCLVTHQYLSTVDSRAALPWGQAICVFTPYITYAFGQLVISVVPAPAWLPRFQRVNLAVTSLFAFAVLLDMRLHTELSVLSTLQTDLTTAHRHRLGFTLAGHAYLTFVSVAFTIFSVLLFRARSTRPDVLPMVTGCVLYFAATIADFGILTDLRDGYFIQHFGFFALVVGSWRVLARRFERTLDDLRAAVGRLEEQRRRLLLSAPMLHKQRLDGLGTLTAAIAHEINSPIQGIMGYAHMLKRSVRHDSLATDYADKIDKEGARIADIVRGLLRFGRSDESDVTVVEPAEVVRITLALTQTAVRAEGITLRTNIADGLPPLRCHPYQVQQVLVNLINNARDALAARSPQRTDEKAIYVVVDHELRGSTRWVTFAVRDTADGIAESVAERIFDPFFTTKSEKGGTGLGLAISQGIMEAHRGSLRLGTTHRRGTTFLAELPAAAEESGIKQVSA